MNSLKKDIEQEVKELFTYLIIDGNIEFNKFSSEHYTKGIIISMNKFIDIYINLLTYKKNKIWRYINYLNFKLRNISSKILKYKTANKKNLKKILLLIYLMIYRYQISTLKFTNMNSENKFFRVKKLYQLLKTMSAITSKFYLSEILDIEELGIISKILIIFSINDSFKNIKENSDIKNIMFFKECIDVILLCFNVTSNEKEQKFLIDIFTYINNNICFRDKNNTNLNYTNKFYLLNNDHKTTKLIKLMNFIYKINNKDLTKIYFEFLTNIYYFQFSYNYLTWGLYELLEPLLKNIKVKDYKTLLQEVSFPEFQFNFIKQIISKERKFIKDNTFIFKNAFYFSGKQPNSGIIAEIGKLSNHFLLTFGFNFIITETTKIENIIFQIKNQEQKVQLKAMILKKNEGYYFYLIDSKLNADGKSWNIQINPNYYYSFVITVEKGKNLTICSNALKTEVLKIKIKEMKTANLLLSVGCEVEKISAKSNLINKNYSFMNSFTGFIGDIFIINLQSYKEKYPLQKNIFDFKGKYGYTLIKSLWEQKSLGEYITSNIDKTQKSVNDDENYFKQLFSEKKKFKIFENIDVYVDSSNFRLVDYMDNIDYMNYDNKYHQKESLLTKVKKENQFFNNLRTKESTFNNKIIAIGCSLLNCNFNFVENMSGLIKFVEEDGIFYMLLIFEYYYQILFRLSKDVLGDNKDCSVILYHELNEILKVIEKGIEDNIDFFLKKIIETHFNIKTYKIILFYYQMNVVIKQFLLLKNINDNIFQLLINYLDRYQKPLKDLVNIYDEDVRNFYRNQRNFFFDFLLNPAFYKQTETFNLLKNLNSFLDSAFTIIQDNILNEEILTENIFEKICNLSFIFNKELELESNETNRDKNEITFKMVKAKYMYLLINYIDTFDLESNKDLTIVDIFCKILLSNQDKPIILFNLTLILFASKIIKEIQHEEFLQKMRCLFNNNYFLTNDDNILYSISSMLILASYYLIKCRNDTEKIQFFKNWYLQLNQRSANIYFDNIYNLIVGGVFDIKQIIIIPKNILNNKDTPTGEEKSSHQKLFDKMESIAGSQTEIKKLIEQNILSQLSSLSGYKMTKTITKTINGDSNITSPEMNIDESKKLNRKEINEKSNIKLNIKVNLEENELEIENIKTKLNQQKHYSNYYCFLDDIKKRCFIYNPKNQLIKRLFSHIFYKSLFHCEAFMLIKNKYFNTFPEANVENKQLNYPTKIKNFSNILEPKLFLKKDYNFYNKIYFKISHDFLINIPPYYEEPDEKKKVYLDSLIKANVSDINFYEHRFNINDILEEKDRYFNAELITPQFTYFGFLILGNHYLYFGTKNQEPINLRDKTLQEIDIQYIEKFSFSNRDKDNKTKKKKSYIIYYQHIQRIIKRRSFLMYQSFEVYCENGKSYFFNLYRKEYCETAFKILGAIRDNLDDKDKFEFINENTSEEIKEVNYEVKKGIINNFVYLLKLNYLSARTYNDLNQYPVFPWLFFDIKNIDAILTSEKNNIDKIETTVELSVSIGSEQDIENLENEKTENIKMSNEELTKKLKLRNFIYPISMQTQDKRENFINNNYIPHGTHYSTASYIYYYLIRNNPFNESMIQLQNLNKENPNRLFTSLEDSLTILYESIENREPCPQFFTNFDYYCNLNCAFLGFQHNDSLVDDFRINKGNDISGNLFSTYFKYLYLFRKLLNSFLISKFLPNWIDFIFGIKQTEKTKESFYIWNKVSYEEKTKLDKKLEKYIQKYKNEELTNKEVRNKINLKIDFLNNFGIIPHKVLNSSIKLKTSAKIKNLPDILLEINDNYFFLKGNDNNILILFKNPKDNDKTKKILLWNHSNILDIKNPKDKKNLFNCGYIKQLEKVTMKNNDKKIPIYKPNYSMCKFEMFNKLFIVTCRYLGNIFKIQNSDYYIDVFCEDFVSSIACKKALNSALNDDIVIYTGLKNGKLIEWHIKNRLNDFKKINVKDRNIFHCHKGEITCIELYKNQNILITGGLDKMIFIRKTCDFELLTAINLTYCYMNPIISQKIDIIPTLIKVSNLNCIYVLLHNYESGKSFIRGYNLNGLFFKQGEENYYMNICFTKNCNLLVSYYDKEKCDILNCYDLEKTDFSLDLPKFVESIEKNVNKNKKKKENKEKDFLIWNDYDYNNHELILLYKNKIVRGNIKEKDDQKNLEFY